MAASIEFRPAGSGGLCRASPLEWEEGRLLIDVGAGRWEDLRLEIQGVAQPIYGLREAGRIVAAADWPRRGAGHWRGQLIVDGLATSFEITVLPRKLDAAAFRHLLDDLDARLPGSIAHGLDRAGAFAGRAVKPPRPSTPREELARLRRTVLGDETGPGLAACLDRVTADPHVGLVDEQRWISAETARRVSASRLGAAIGHPGNLLPIDNAYRLERVFDNRARVTFDTPENRFLAAFVDDVLGRLQRVRACGDVCAEAETLINVLRRRRRAAAFLNDTGPARASPTNPSQVLLRRPGYREAHRRWRQYRRSSALQIALPLRDTPLENTPALYEIWASLVAIDRLLGSCHRWGWRVVRQALVIERDGWIFDLDWNGRDLLHLIHPDGRHLTVAAQRGFSSNSRPLRATSFGQRPDLVFEASRPGLPTRLMILDPKYKLAFDGTTASADGDAITITGAVGGPTKADIDKMHAYRDAIRHANGTAVAAIATILYPGEASHWFPDALGTASGVGAIGLRPGHADLAAGIEDILDRWLNDEEDDA